MREKGLLGLHTFILILSIIPLIVVIIMQYIWLNTVSLFQIVLCLFYAVQCGIILFIAFEEFYDSSYNNNNASASSENINFPPFFPNPLSTTNEIMNNKTYRKISSFSTNRILIL